MKLWKKPRLAAALCAVVVLVCAAAPAVFLSVVDAASLGHSQAVADPYTAPTPTAVAVRGSRTRKRMDSCCSVPRPSSVPGS